MSTGEFSSGIYLQGSFRRIPWGCTEEDLEEADRAGLPAQATPKLIAPQTAHDAEWRLPETVT